VLSVLAVSAAAVEDRFGTLGLAHPWLVVGVNPEK
jgi:hypothetical protein